MSNAPLTLRTLDYQKYKRLVIEGDVSLLCRSSKEVRSFYESTNLLKSRYSQFEPGDEVILMKIYGLYKMMLDAKKNFSLDVKSRSGWWEHSREGVDAGKLKSKNFKEVLLEKCCHLQELKFQQQDHDMAGVFVFLHKTVPCFRFVGNSDRVFETVENLVKSAFEGRGSEILTALLVTSLASSWDFYILPINNKNIEDTRWLQNDVIMRHDSLWPKGLNVTIEAASNEDFVMLRRSCLRHRWPSHDLHIEKEALNPSDLLKELQSQSYVSQFRKGNNDQIISYGLSLDEVKLSSHCLYGNEVENLDTLSSAGSTITTTTIRTALESNELERNREDLMVKLNHERIRTSLKGRAPAQKRGAAGSGAYSSRHLQRK